MIQFSIYNKGEIVWIKQANKPWWPGKIKDLSSAINNTTFTISLFGGIGTVFANIEDIIPFEGNFQQSCQRHHFPRKLKHAYSEASESWAGLMANISLNQKQKISKLKLKMNAQSDGSKKTDGLRKASARQQSDFDQNIPTIQTKPKDLPVSEIVPTTETPNVEQNPKNKYTAQKLRSLAINSDNVVSLLDDGVQEECFKVLKYKEARKFISKLKTELLRKYKLPYGRRSKLALTNSWRKQIKKCQQKGRNNNGNTKKIKNQSQIQFDFRKGITLKFFRFLKEKGVDAKKARQVSVLLMNKIMEKNKTRLMAFNDMKLALRKLFDNFKMFQIEYRLCSEFST